MLMDALLVLAGLVMLFFGGDWLVQGAVQIAKRAGLSKLMIGTVLVGFGTSTPELLVSLDAALTNQPGIALGNIVGSNIANVLLILGICALIAPIAAGQAAVRRDMFCGIGASLILVGLCLYGLITWYFAAIMFALLLGYVGWCYWQEKQQGHDDAPDNTPLLPWWRAALLGLGGLIVLIIGARLLVTGAVGIARDLGVSETIIGLTLVAVGTSLPELAAGVIAALKRETDLVIGNILGSNLYNILGILGITGLITAVPVDARIAALDVWIMLGVSVLLVPFVLFLKQLPRWSGALLLALYAGYCATMLA